MRFASLAAVGCLVLLAGCGNCVRKATVLPPEDVPPPIAQFQDLRADMESAIQLRSGDAQTNAYNYAVIFNTASMGDPGSAALKAIYRSMLWHYLVPRDPANGLAAGDTVSTVPFQRTVRAEARYDVPFARDRGSISEFLGAIPDTNYQDGGGHDLEGAVWSAWERTAHPRSTVYIVFSSSEYSSSSTKLAKEDGQRVAALARDGMAEPVRKRTISTVVEWPKGTSHQLSVYMRVYVPTGLAALGPLGPRPRDARVRDLDAPRSVEAPCQRTGLPAGSLGAVGGALGGVLLLVVGALLTRKAFSARKPVSVMVDYVVDTLRPGEVTYVGGVGVGGGAIELEKLPSGQKVAGITIGRGRTILVQNVGFGVFTLVGSSPVEISTGAKIIRVKNNQTGDVCEFKVGFSQ